ncbi:MAG: hypothetical protein Q8O25_09845 [Sulfurisoma sp.]|nr:hypothetical protein [Sulfurisoma sp.]
MEPLLFASRERLDAALDIFLASVADYPGFDPERGYTPKEREPLDALSDRYLRAFESALRFFRTWEQVREAAPSESFRDLLLRMEKLGLISAAGDWLTLRDVRNRIAHEYLPDELARIYAALVGAGATELRRLRAQAGRLT